MSDFHNLQEENRRLTAEVERLKAVIAGMTMLDSEDNLPLAASAGIDHPMTFTAPEEAAKLNILPRAPEGNEHSG